jgi:hypothetical protein
MLKKIFTYAMLLLLPIFSNAKIENTTSVQTFFKNLEGKWYGEIPGIYKIDMDVNAFQKNKPWSLQSGVIKIQEGQTTKYEFELSKNETILDQDEVYFFKLKNLENSETHIYTLSGRSDLKDSMIFWHHFIETRDGLEYTSANAIKIFKTDKILTFGFVSGNGYCKENGAQSLCATSGYTPYQLQKINIK